MRLISDLEGKKIWKREKEGRVGWLKYHEPHRTMKPMLKSMYHSID
jgi:hypothetical protein